MIIEVFAKRGKLHADFVARLKVMIYALRRAASRGVIVQHQAYAPHFPMCVQVLRKRRWQGVLLCRNAAE